MSDAVRHKTSTLLVRSGRELHSSGVSVNPPVFHASTITFPTLAALEASDAKPFEGVHYGRTGTPTTFAFEEAVATLEGGGPHRHPALWPGRHRLHAAVLRDGRRSRAGVRQRLFPDPSPAGRAAQAVRRRDYLLRPYHRRRNRTGWSARNQGGLHRIPGSRTFEVQDIPAIVEAAHARDAIVVMDNTWAAGLYFQPHQGGGRVDPGGDQVHRRPFRRHAGVVTTSVRGRAFAVAARPHGFGAMPARRRANLGLRGLRSIGPRLAARERAQAGPLAGKRPEVAEGPVSGAAGLSRPRSVEA